MDYARLREIASKATPGPWRWWGRLKGPMSLVSRVPGGGTPFVMGFTRLGMQDAQPTFAVDRNLTEGALRGCGWMKPASELGIREASYRDDIVAIDSPDATFIAAADPTTLLSLLDQRDSVIFFCKELRRVCAQKGREEATENGWNADLGIHHAQFDLCGSILERLGESDDMNWARDALGVDRPGGKLPPLKALDVGADGWPRSL